MKITEVIRPKEVTQVPEPPIARFLFADTRMAWLWLIVRLYVGYQWITAGLEKLTGYSFTFDASFGQNGHGLTRSGPVVRRAGVIHCPGNFHGVFTKQICVAAVDHRTVPAASQYRGGGVAAPVRGQSKRFAERL